ncbi:hypothetical protein U9M48_026048 [Paspalum notatum var. saurae]|uniref:Uncharacterized protein n=1 Tax=Paspalum notatum var. saurae TaxID=547442 RepID=A0AAQ3WXR8_PASNO
MLEDIGKIKQVYQTIVRATSPFTPRPVSFFHRSLRSLTAFIYSHTRVLAFMRNYLGIFELEKLAIQQERVGKDPLANVHRRMNSDVNQPWVSYMAVCWMQRRKLLKGLTMMSIVSKMFGILFTRGGIPS